MTSQTNHQPFPDQKWRNRPGRDLLLALVIGFAVIIVPAIIAEPDLASFVAGGLMAALVPVGVMVAVMRADHVAVIGLGLILAFGLCFAMRMPGTVRVPLLLAVFGGWYWCALQSGTLVS